MKKKKISIIEDFGITLEKAAEIITHVSCWAAFENPNGEKGDDYVIGRLRNNYEGSQREFGFYMAGKISSIHQERAMLPISPEQKGFIQEAFCILDDLGMDTYKPLYDLMYKRVYSRMVKEMEQEEGGEGEDPIQSPDIPLNSN